MLNIAKNLESLSPTFNGELLAAFFKAVGDDLRLNILRLLHHNDYGVMELCQLLDVKQSGMSHHLKVLANAGLVVTRRDGNSIFYRRAPTAAIEELQLLQQTLFSMIDQLQIPTDQQKRISRINEERSRASLEFFQQHADKFQANQDLIASYAQYGNSITEFLDAAYPSGERVLEIGPGEGHFLADLSPRFSEVYALDNSAEMLARAKKFATEKALDNIEFFHGDTRWAVVQQLSADCITVNMVLHHTPDPAQIFQDLSRLLSPGGSLLITELCQHNQSWTRESCGDLWLGFESEDLNRWATAAGLSIRNSLYLTQRNGFQIQLQAFVKPSATG
ncbi:MAG: metalloregulator ArsR/SmtB family transcription factor [Porticoccaceae bacterium]|nr:ArsR family transcriptional regulator [Pseudomonadales bacterium]MCP5173080.1 metalloregulator ArsR/SmtB family transcription factor [Pseudomonadales bacterium]